MVRQTREKREAEDDANGGAMSVVDLADFAAPVSASFRRGTDLPEPGLTDGQIGRYHRDGFVSGVRVLGAEQIDVLRDELVRLMEPEQAANPLFYEYHHNEASEPGTVLFHALGAWRVSPAFHDLIFLPPVVKAAEQLLGTSVRFWHDQIFVKPPHDGAVVEWHQDYSYWTRTKPMSHLTCWIALDDSTEENGCVRYVPGSHKWPLLPRFHLSGDMSAVFEHLIHEQRAAFNPVPAVLRAGEASFHHPLMLHGSYENRSDRPRRAAVLNFFTDGVISDADEALLNGVPAIPRGRKIDGRFFPLLDG